MKSSMMFSSYNLLVVTIALVLSMSTHFAAADSDVINVHGSGTTNPSKYYPIISKGKIK